MLEYFMYCYGDDLLLLVLCAIAGTLGRAVYKMAKTYINTETKRTVAKIAAAFVEQVWKAIHGPEKLQKALETAEILLKKKGIDFDAEEMTVLIEAAVAEFNEAFRKPLEEEGAADAARRVDGFFDPSDKAYSDAVEAGTM